MKSFSACFVAVAILSILLIGQSTSSKASFTFFSSASEVPQISPSITSSPSVALSTKNYACPAAPVASTRTNITSQNTPFGLAVDYANKNVYVSDQTPDVIQGITGSTESMMSNTTTVGNNLKGLAYDSANHQLFVVSQGVLGTTAPVVYWVNGEGTGATLPADAVPIEMVYDSYNGYLYVSDYGTDQISVVNPSTPSDLVLLNNVDVGSRPWGLSVDPYNGFVFAADSGSDAISVLSGTSVIGSLGSNGTDPIGVLLDPINQMLYVTNSESNSLSIINASGNTFSSYKLLHTTTTSGLFNDPEEMGLDCAHNSLWVANDGSNSVTAFLLCPSDSYSYSSVQYLANYSSSTQPQEFAFDNFTQGMYVSDYGTKTVQVFPTSGIQSPLYKGFGCPMGVADYGIDGQQTYSYTTKEFEAVTTFQSPFSIGVSSSSIYNHEASDQLNVMAYGVATSIPDGVYWTQNVLSLNQSSRCPNTCYQFTSEFFNVTRPGSDVDYTDTFASTCVKNGGTPIDLEDTFYCTTPWRSGLTFPLTVKIIVITGTETSGKFKDENYMSFEYMLSDGPQKNKLIEFDHWDFNNLLSGSKIKGDPHFLVSGNPMTTPWFSATTRCGTGTSGSYACPLLNDAENVIAGFGGLANVNFSSVNAKMQLLYMKGSKLDFVPHAFSAGTDTGENAINVYSLGNAAQFSGTATGDTTEGSDDAIQLY
jgi:DNA-binding beta-propeller fold protein YncE